MDFHGDIHKQMKKIAQLACKSVFMNIDPLRRDNTFELFGLDYMIDENLKVYLIEVNTNPCLELSSSLLARLIPQMIENVLKITVDPVFPPPEFSLWKQSGKAQIPDKIFDNNNFELIFDEQHDGQAIKQLLDKNKEEILYDIEEEDEEHLSDEEN